METPFAKIDEAVVFELDPTEVIVSDELPRHRKDLGDIKKMVESINKFGQLQPVVINRNKELICGGRRLAACILGGFKVRVCYKDTVDPVRMREMELEENVQRKALTPAEESFAVRDLVELKQKIYGKATQGRAGGFSLSDAAEIVGKTKSYIVEQMQLADAIDAFPELAQAKTKSEIKSAYKGLERLAKNMDAIQHYEETIKSSKEYVLVNRDAKEHIKGIPSESIDLFFTDPPYGIEINEVAMTLGGATAGRTTTTGIKYEDSWEYAKAVLEVIIPESYRITKTSAHAYMFCGRDRFVFQWVHDEMVKAGWLVLPWPLIWIKRTTGQNNQPERWPSSAYEAILFARKPNSSIIIQGRPDWIQCDPVNRSEKLHPAEKPIALCKELISRVAMPGYRMYDPCMGSGALVKAAVDMKLLALGCEADVKAYANALSRFVETKQENTNETNEDEAGRREEAVSA